MNVEDLMVRDFLKISPGDSVLAAGEKMKTSGLGHAFVYHADEFLGIVSKESLVGRLHLLKNKPLENIPASQLMEDIIRFVHVGDYFYDGVDQLMNSKSMVDVVPVLEGEAIIGYVSSKEYTKYYAETMQGKFKVRDIMHFSPTKVNDYTPLDKVVRELVMSHSRKVIVMMGDVVAGVISVKDLSLAVFEQKKNSKAISEMTAEDVMTTPPITVNVKEDSAKAASIMIEKHIGGLPVIRDRLEGILTRRDLLKGFEILEQQGEI